MPKGPTTIRGRSWSRSLYAACAFVCLLSPGCASFETAPYDLADGGPGDGAPSPGEADGGPDAENTTEVIVPASEDWIDTGIALEPGEHVRVTAAGSVWFDESVTATGPEGTTVASWQQWNLLTCVNHASLIGRIGEGGEPFLIGAGALFAATEEDRLYLRINDTMLTDNVGSFETTIATDLPHEVIEDAPVTVSALSIWTDAGIDVAAADLLTVSASGTITLSPTATCDPAGMPDRDDLQGSNVIVCPDHGALIGKVGADGAPFVVGRSESVAAPVDGRLYLGVNDTTIDNNSGAFAAAVTVSAPER